MNMFKNILDTTVWQDKSLGLLVNLLRISALPLMKPLRKAALELVESAEG